MILKYYECKSCNKVLQGEDDIAAMLDARADGCPKKCNFAEVPQATLTPAQNILLNLSGGMPLEMLNPNELKILQTAIGLDWFDKLGYKEPTHKRPQSA